MIPITIKRRDGSDLVTVEIDESTPEDLRLRMAVLLALEATPHLRSAELPGVNLSFAVAQQANLLQGMDLRGSNLSGADFRGANLYGTDLRDCDLTGADFTGALLAGCHMGGADATGALLDGVDLSDAHTIDTKGLPS